MANNYKHLQPKTLHIHYCYYTNFLFIQEQVNLTPGRDIDFAEEIAKAHPHDCIPVESGHPLYVLYTSGTTGVPKVMQLYYLHHTWFHYLCLFVLKTYPTVY